MAKDHIYKGERITRCDYIGNKRWRIVGYHPATGLPYAEEAGTGEGYNTLAAAKDAIDLAQADKARGDA